MGNSVGTDTLPFPPLLRPKPSRVY